MSVSACVCAGEVGACTQADGGDLTLVRTLHCREAINALGPAPPNALSPAPERDAHGKVCARASVCVSVNREMEPQIRLVSLTFLPSSHSPGQEKSSAFCKAVRRRCACACVVGVGDTQVSVWPN